MSESGSLAAATTASIVPNRLSRVAAVLSPTPATPGRPSEASPRSVARSAYWRASTPYLLRTQALSTRSCLLTPRAT